MDKPKIRFKGYTDAWEQRKVKDIAPLQRGFDLPTSQMEEGNYPVVMSNGIGGYHSQYKVKGPGIVTGRSGTIGKLHYIEDNFWPHNTTLWVTDFYGNNQKFVYYMYQGLDLSRFSTGSGVPTLNRNDVHDKNVHIPNFGEQEKISEYLTALDYLITLHQRKCEEVKKLKKYMLQNMFPRNGSNVPEIRFDGFTNAWEQRKLGDCCDMYNGDRSSKYPNADDMVSDGIPFINAGDLENGTVNLMTCNRITREKYNDLGGAKLQRGDIVYCLRGTLGKNAFIDNFDEGTVASSLVALRPKNIGGKYLHFIINSDIEYRQRIVRNEGAAQPNLSAKSVSEYIIPVPSEAEQQQISAYFSRLDTLITLHQRKCEKLQNIKKFMLQNMFV